MNRATGGTQGTAPGATWTITSAPDLMAQDLPDLHWVVWELLCEGLVILAGKPKVGKSWLALQVALAVALGRQALGYADVDAGDVLYLALEDTLRRLQDRLGKLLAPGDQPPANLDFVTEAPGLAAGLTQLIRDWLVRHPNGRLVVIDTLGRVAPQKGRGADVYQADTTLMANLQKLAKDHRVAVCVVHHQRKAPADDHVDEVSGSAGLTGAADTILALVRKRGTAKAVLKVTGRDVETAELTLDFLPARAWAIVGPGTGRLSPQRVKILEFLESQPGAAFTPKECAIGTGISYDSIRHLLPKMAGESQIQQVGQGRYAALPRKSSSRSGLP